ncbi:hypothetical protein [Glycomyces tarimensis]
MSSRIPTRAHAAAAVQLVIAAALLLAAIALLTTTDEAVQRTRAAMDLDPMLDSAHYLDYIAAIVNYRHGVVAVAFLVAAIACAFLGTFGLTGRLRSPAAGWTVWGIAIAATCVLAYGERTGFALRPSFNYELVQRFASQNESPPAEASQILAYLCLLVGLPLSSLWQSTSRSQETTSAPSP